MNKYYLRARLFPTILTSAPAFLLLWVVLLPHKAELTSILIYLPAVLQAVGYGALVYFSVMFNRAVGKEFFEIIHFKDEMYMPTTNRLLWANTYYDGKTKKRLHDKIKDKYKIELPDSTEETRDEKSARKQIVEAVGGIRESLRSSPLLLQHNIEYGFARNLLGGCIVAALISLGIFVYALIAHRFYLSQIAGILLAIHLVPIFFGKIITRWFGNRYSLILVNQFLSI